MTDFVYGLRHIHNTYESEQKCRDRDCFYCTMKKVMNVLNRQYEFVPPLIPTDNIVTNMTHTLGENFEPIKRFYQRRRILFSNSKYSS